MDHIKVLKRAFKVTWHYRALWVFGIVLALTVAILYPNNGNNPSNSTQYTSDGRETGRWERIPEEEVPGPYRETAEQIAEYVVAHTAMVVAIGVLALGGCCLLSIALHLAIHGVRCMMETSLIRMVDDYEETGEKRTVKEGLRMGWSRSAFRLFLIDLVVWLIKFAAFAPLVILWFLLAGLAVVVMIFGGILGIVIGTLLGVALIGALILLGILGFIIEQILQALKAFFYRTCVLEKTGVFDAISQGASFVKRHLLWDIVIMLAIILGLYLAWFIVMFFVGFIVIILALMLSVIPLLLIGLVGYLIFGGVVPWILGGLIALLVLVLAVSVPLLFLNGLGLTFISTLWTLTYRELRALEELEEKPEEQSEEASSEATDTETSDPE